MKKNFRKDLEKQKRTSSQATKKENLLFSHAFHLSIQRGLGLLLFVVITLSSCSGASPVIYDYTWDLRAHWDYPGQRYEKLDVHILADDEDGFSEIYEVYLIHDESERYWRIIQDDWKTIELDGVTWIAVQVTTEDYQILPRGKYRILVLDFSGFKDERSFFVKKQYPRLASSTSNDENTIPSQLFPVFQKISKNTFVPQLGKEVVEKSSDFYLQLLHPLPKVDVAGNVRHKEHRRLVSLLGENGSMYKVDPNKELRFQGGRDTEFTVYLHYRLEESLTVSSGPFVVQLEDQIDRFADRVNR